MTDNEIIKALKWLIFNFPKIENPKDETDKMCNCINLYCQNAIDELNRKDAEIADLKSDLTIMKNNFENAKKLLGDSVKIGQRRQEKLVKAYKKLRTAKSEAIKEFESKAIEKAYINNYWDMVVNVASIEAISKEMVGDDNA